MSKEGRFFHESLEDCQSIKQFVQSLQEGLEKGEIQLATNKENLVLNLPRIVRFSVKAKKKGNNNKLQIKLSWEDGEYELGESSSLLKPADRS
ncbi:MAG: amphi-Trp domain-containing protein [Desulfurivibrio sp.]|nr:amphi-Trp domain-containing protein [Desulfurivibrio sp.]